jgi:hypothetical protein
MGTEAPRWWRQLLDQLQVAAAEASAAAANGIAADMNWQPGNLQAICATIADLDCLPVVLPKAVWKKVLALQVLVRAANWADGFCLISLPGLAAAGSNM